MKTRIFVSMAVLGMVCSMGLNSAQAIQVWDDNVVNFLPDSNAGGPYTFVGRDSNTTPGTLPFSGLGGTIDYDLIGFLDDPQDDLDAFDFTIAPGETATVTAQMTDGGGHIYFMFDDHGAAGSQIADNFSPINVAIGAGDYSIKMLPNNDTNWNATISVTGGTAPPQAASTPEPSTIVLAVIGMFGLGFCGWRKRHAVRRASGIAVSSLLVAISSLPLVS